MIHADKKAAGLGAGEAASYNTHNQDFSGFSIAIPVWRISFQLEQSRHRHAALRHFWREAGFCILLALLKFGRLA